jgi:hypothetical protein
VRETRPGSLGRFYPPGDCAESCLLTPGTCSGLRYPGCAAGVERNP